MRDELVFWERIEQHRSVLSRYISAVVTDTGLSEEIIQDVCLIAWLKYDSFIFSQAFPIRVSLDSDSTVSTCEAFYEKSYTVHSLENAKVSKLSNERSEMNSDFLFDSFSESSDVETKQLSLNTPTDIILFNPTEETMSYHLFAFVNNTPVMWDSSPYSSITLPAKSQFSSSILLSDSQMQNISDDSPDLFFLVAVPIHEAAQQQGTLVLKTKTIAFVT